MRAFHLDHDRRKRIVELFFVPLLIISLLPAYLLVSAAVLIALGRPVLYRGDRVGRHDRVFQQLKFRTMIRATTDASGRVLS